MVDKKIPKTDEFGITQFTVYSDSRNGATFEHQSGDDLIFVTFFNSEGVATDKLVVNINNPNNEKLLETYEAYIREAKTKEQNDR